jgi:hypothetical protein
MAEKEITAQRMESPGGAGKDKKGKGLLDKFTTP